MAAPLPFANLARAAKVAALLFFLLPWVQITYSPERLGEALGMPRLVRLLGPREDCALLSASGLQLARGGAPVNSSCLGLFGELIPAERITNDARNPFSPMDGWTIGAALLILAGLLAGLLLPLAAGLLAGAGASALALAAIGYSVLIRIPGAIPNMSIAGGLGPAFPKEQLKQIFQPGLASGFWLVCAALAAAIAFSLLAARRSPPAPSGP